MRTSACARQAARWRVGGGPRKRSRHVSLWIKRSYGSATGPWEFLGDSRHGSHAGPGRSRRPFHQRRSLAAVVPPRSSMETSPWPEISRSGAPALGSTADRHRFCKPTCSSSGEHLPACHLQSLANGRTRTADGAHAPRSAGTTSTDTRMPPCRRSPRDHRRGCEARHEDLGGDCRRGRCRRGRSQARMGSAAMCDGLCLR